MAHSGFVSSPPNTAWQIFVAVGLTVVFGCGQGEHPEYVVQGRITYQGKAIGRGTINFFPKEGNPLGGPIQEDGTYEFSLPEGSYRVAIRANTEIADDWDESIGPPTGFKSLLPPAYSRPDTSNLTITVKAQSPPQVHDFKLQ